MLEKMLKMDSQVLRALLLAAVGFVGVVGSLFGLDEAVFNASAGRVLESFLTLITAVGIGWAWYARTKLPNPPLSEAAVTKTADLLATQRYEAAVKAGGTGNSSASVGGGSTQGGFTRLSVSIALALMLVIGLGVAACGGTMGAYKEARNDGTAAEIVGDTAYVIAEHYGSLVREAGNLRQSGALTGKNLELVQDAEIAARPYFQSLRTLSAAFAALPNAKTQAELQAATDNAVTELAKLTRIFNQARGVK